MPELLRDYKNCDYWPVSGFAHRYTTSHFFHLDQISFKYHFEGLSPFRTTWLWTNPFLLFGISAGFLYCLALKARICTRPWVSHAICPAQIQQSSTLAQLSAPMLYSFYCFYILFAFWIENSSFVYHHLESYLDATFKNGNCHCARPTSQMHI